MGSKARGEAWGDGREWQRCAAAPAHCSGEPAAAPLPPHAASKGWDPLARETFKIFSFHERVFVGQIWHRIAKLASVAWVWDPQLQHPRLLCRWDATLGWAAPTRSCYVAGVSTCSYNVCSLPQQQHDYFFSFQTLKVGKEGKLMAPKHTSCSPLSRETFRIPLAP